MVIPFIVIEFLFSHVQILTKYKGNTNRVSRYPRGFKLHRVLRKMRWESRAVVAHAFNPSTSEAEEGGDLCEFAVSLVCKASSRTVRAVTQRNPVLKNKTSKQRNKKMTWEPMYEKF